jgi:regulator of ribosome biosynthesis
MGLLTQMPRAMPIPKVKKITAWEKYAKDKGIKHKRKDRMK